MSRIDKSFRRTRYVETSVIFGLIEFQSPNHRIYCAVQVEISVSENDLLLENDIQHLSFMCYDAISWHCKTEMRFIEGDAAKQEHLPSYRRNIKTVNQVVYRHEMCTQMFHNINQVMEDELTRHQDARWGTLKYGICLKFLQVFQSGIP